MLVKVIFSVFIGILKLTKMYRFTQLIHLLYKRTGVVVFDKLHIYEQYVLKVDVFDISHFVDCFFSPLSVHTSGPK